jgi:predicted O-linked N-acetylglucosamine transferase (SPINDLY family)
METARILTDRFASLGIDSSRLILTYTLPEQDYFQAYQSIDIALDPFPFNGRATTCDALWMGVPVLSLAGNDCRSRQGSSMLSSIGLTDFVAETPDKLVALAAIWADQIDTLADLRSGLREMMVQSPLTDAAAYVRNLETAYLQAVTSR